MNACRIPFFNLSKWSTGTGECYKNELDARVAKPTKNSGNARFGKGSELCDIVKQVLLIPSEQ